MAMRVGIDLMSVASVQEAVDTHGLRYLQRVFSERELTDSIRGAAPDPRRLAERVAAKEATFKVLELSDDAVAWREVEIHREVSGSLTVVLSGQAKRLARRAGIAELSLSLTSERGCAAAVVIAEIAVSADT